jgi:hypothetical protein
MLPLVCPSCGAKYNVPEGVEGKSTTCPKCQARITVPGSKPAPPSPLVPQVRPVAPVVKQHEPAKPLVPIPPQQPQVFDVQVVKACPFCGETVMESAKKCKHCGEILDVTLRASEEGRRAADRGRGDVHVVVNQSQAVEVETRVDVRTGGAGSGFPHLFHIIMCLLTCGLWLPIYALHAMLASRGGGMTLALLLGIPVALVCAGCFGCGALMVLTPPRPRPTPTISTTPTTTKSTSKTEGGSGAKMPPTKDTSDKKAKVEEDKGKVKADDDKAKAEAAEKAKAEEAKAKAEAADKAKAEKEKALAEAKEKEAARKLGLAKPFITSGKEKLSKKGQEQEGLKLIQTGLKRLEEIIAEFPKTAAAAEAQKLVEETQRFVDEWKKLRQ